LKEAEADAGVGGKNSRSGQAVTKLIVPKVTVLNKLTSREWKGIVATVGERH
jgi:hypothetical protein